MALVPAPQVGLSGDVREIVCTDRRDIYNHIKDRLGTEWEDVEILKWINDNFRVSANHSIRASTKSGNFALRRHPENTMRGDKGSRDKKRSSVETFGLRLDWRSPPALVQHPEEGHDDEYLTLSWGTLFEGLGDAARADAEKKQKLVQASLLMDIPACSLYLRSLPKDAARFLVHWTLCLLFVFTM